MLCVDGACRTMGLNDWSEGLVKGVWAREYERGDCVDASGDGSGGL